MSKSFCAIGALAALTFAACAHHERTTVFAPVSIDAAALLTAASQRYLETAALLDPAGGHPRSTTSGGRWHVTPVNEWTSGFFPGTLWYLLAHSGDARLRDQAERWTIPLAAIPRGTFSHDLGFQFNSSFVNAYRITGDERFRVPALNAARLLAARFNPTVGAIKSWDWMEPSRPFPVIADNMMNLELLFWGARQPDGDARWQDMAVQHARTTLAQHVRPDGGSYHVVVFDPASGRVLERITHQGHADTTTWARGQSWLLYGFTMAFRETGDRTFLEAAGKVADYTLARLPPDLIPCWDFHAPGCPATAKRDASAAAVAASALLELSRYVPGQASDRYRAAALGMLATLSSPAYLTGSSESAALLAHGVGHHPKGTEVDVGLAYADYYYVEALLRLLAQPAQAIARVLPSRTPRLFTARGDLLRTAKERLLRGAAALHPALARLIHDADSALRVGPFTVTSKERVPPSGDKHDYVSYGPYWWPDSTKPNGLPYIRRDGEVNWELRRESDALRLYAMTDAVETLAQAYFFTERAAYAERAALLLRTWFIDPATRMNPHLRFAQAIPGVSEGRGIGIIDTRDLGRLTDAISLMAVSPAWTPADDAALRDWLVRYLDWLKHSEHGKDEADEPNNHGTWYDVQVAALELFVGDSAAARALFENSRTRRIAAHIDATGRQPLELARTRSLHYSIENLDAMTRLAEMARATGVDLWRWESPHGGSIQKALDYIAPYADTTRSWPDQQITTVAPDRFIPLMRRARTALADPRYSDVLANLPAGLLQTHRAQLLYPEPASEYDAVVDAAYQGADGALRNGTPTYRSIARALEAIAPDNSRPHVIHIRNGRYYEKLTVATANVHLIGEQRDSTILTYDAAADTPDPAGGTYGTRGSFTLRIAAPDFRLANMTVENGFDYMTNYRKPNDDPARMRGSQGVAVMLGAGSDRAVFENCRIAGHQDTLFPDAGRSYFHRCTILGSVDFIFGAGRAVFDDVDIVSRDRGSRTNNGYITAASTPISQAHGFLIVNSRLHKESPAMAAASVTLGRPWHPFGDPNAVGSVVFMNTWIDDHVGTKGWDSMYSTDTAGTRVLHLPSEARLFEYNNRGPGAVSSPARRQLTAEQAASYTITKVLDGWQPVR